MAGVGTMQATLVAEVRQNTIRINYVERDIKNTAAAFETNVDKITRHAEKNLEQQRELISLVHTMLKQYKQP